MAERGRAGHRLPSGLGWATRYFGGWTVCPPLCPGFAWIHKGGRSSGNFLVRRARVVRLKACLKSLLRQSWTATDRFRNRHRPFGVGRGNGPSCPEADPHHGTRNRPGRVVAVVPAKWLRTAAPRRSSMITCVGPDLAAEYPIRPGGVAEDDRQQKQRAEDQEGLRTRRRGRVPQADARRHDVGP
jgi:hypothetical protein